MLGFDDRPERIGDLEPPLVVNLRGIVAPQDGVCFHLTPQISTAILDKRLGDVNAKARAGRSYAFCSPPLKGLSGNRRATACYDVHPRMLRAGLIGFPSSGRTALFQLL